MQLQEPAATSSSDKRPKVQSALGFLALLLLGAACVGAWWQLPTSQPTGPNANALEWFLNPVEVNAALRLPSMPSALTSVEVIGDKGWAVGLGGTIIATDDGGKTWKPGPHIVAANLRSVRFQSGGKLGWAVGDTGTVLRTEDGGATWSDLSQRPNLDNATDLVDVEHNETTNEVWAVGSNGTVLVSTNNAKSWRKTTIRGSGLTTVRNTSSIFFSQNGNYGWITAEGIILSSIDGGEHWLAAAVSSADGQAPQFKSVWFTGQYGWAVGENGTIVSSSDYGQNWSLPHNSGTAATLNAVAGSAEGIWAAGEKGTLLFSADGLTWASVESGTTADLNSLALFGKTRLDAAVTKHSSRSIRNRRTRQVCQLDTNSDGVIRDLPGGPDAAFPPQSPAQLPQQIPRQAPLDDQNAMPPLPEPRVIPPNVGQVLGKLMGNDHGVAVGDAGTIVYGPNSASPWAPVATAAPALLRSVEVSADGNRVYGFGESGLILESDDAGDSWSSSMPVGEVRLNGSSTVQNGSTWVVGDNGVMLSTSAAGSKWTVHTLANTPDLQDIDFDTNNVIGIAVGKGTSILATSDGGTTWRQGQQLLSEGDSPKSRDTFRSVYIQDADSKAWAVGDRGLLASSNDRGHTWTLSSQLPSPAEKAVGGVVSAFSVNLAAIRFSNDGHTGWLAGDDGIIAKTLDGGATWRIKNRLDGVSLNSLQMARDDQRGWATGNGGLILSTVDGGETWTPVVTGVGSTRLAVAMDSAGKTGWIVGYPPTLLNTKNAGKTWEPGPWPLHYRQFPAPWFWCAVLVSALLVWHMLRPRKESDVKGAAAIAVTDAPTADVEQDKLGFAPLARGISRFLRNTRTEPPLTVAISGGWGSGKSSLMALICQDLRRYKYRPIWFNAWHHQSEEQLLASLLNAIRIQGLPSLLSLDGWAFRMSLLYIRSRSHLLLALLIAAAASYLASYVIFHPKEEWSTLWLVVQNLGNEKGTAPVLTGSDIGSLLSQLAAGLVTWKALSASLKAYGMDPGVLLSNAASRFRISEAQAQTSFRTVFARQFSEVTEALPYRTVIVIDDLDRCRPETILTVLEAVNFLVSSGSCFVIFGMETRYIRAALGQHFEKFAEELALHDPAAAETANDRRWIYAGKYLEKLVNLEIKVPQQEDLSPLLQSSQSTDTHTTNVVLKMLHRWPFFLLLLVALLGVTAGKMMNFPETKQAVSPTAKTSAPLTPPQPAVAKRVNREEGSDAPLPSPRVTQPVLHLPELQVQHASVSSVVGIGSVFAMLLAFAAYVTGVILYRIRTSMRQVNDSGAFNEALGAWLPLVHQRHTTPRAIKRFINRIRYLAMLQQGEQLDHSFMEEIHLRQAPNPQTARSQAIAEHRLVALGALHDLYEDDWRKNVEEENYPPDIAEAINNYQEGTSAGWPPGKEELDAFESSLRGVRVAGEVDILPSDRGRERSERPEKSTERK
ncbi:YCF48-related protein [Pseudomonas farris]